MGSMRSEAPLRNWDTFLNVLDQEIRYGRMVPRRPAPAWPRQPVAARGQI
jgi:hypothetical protein